MNLTHHQITILLGIVTQRLDELHVAITKADKAKHHGDPKLWREHFAYLEKIEAELRFEEELTRPEGDVGRRFHGNTRRFHGKTE